MDETTGVFLHVAGLAEPVYAGWRYCLEMSYVGSSPSIGIYFCFCICFILTHTQL